MMIEALIAFTIAMVLGTVCYQLGRRDGREAQKRDGIEIESEVWIRGLRGEITGYTMSGGMERKEMIDFLVASLPNIIAGLFGCALIAAYMLGRHDGCEDEDEL
jgi:hypothetical protein